MQHFEFHKLQELSLTGKLMSGMVSETKRGKHLTFMDRKTIPSIPPKEIYRFNAIPKNPSDYFSAIENLMLKSNGI